MSKVITLNLTQAQFALVADVLSGALEDLVCEADPNGDKWGIEASCKAEILTPVVETCDAFRVGMTR